MKKLIALLIIAILVPLMGACSLIKSKQAIKEAETTEKFSFVGQPVEPFKVKDMLGTALDESVFTKQKLTMNVFWSPNCVPCIEELSALDRLYDMEAELDFKLISVCVEGDRKDVEALRDTYKMKYPVVMMDEFTMMEACVKDFEFIPFVIFVDQKGRYMKEYLVGSRSYEEYLDHLKQLINKI